MTEKKVAEKEAKKEVATDAAAKKATPKKEAPAKKTSSFAIIATGGKQHVVFEGDSLNIEKLDGEYKTGDKIEFTEVLLVDDGKSTKIGEPTVAGAKVTAEFVENARESKISVIRFRSKSRYFKNRGHRQPYTRVKITKVA